MTTDIAIYDDLNFNSDDLKEMAENVNQVRMAFLCNIETDNADPIAEHHFLIALSALEQATHHLKLAAIYQKRETS